MIRFSCHIDIERQVKSGKANSQTDEMPECGELPATLHALYIRIRIHTVTHRCSLLDIKPKTLEKALVRHRTTDTHQPAIGLWVVLGGGTLNRVLIRPSHCPTSAIDMGTQQLPPVNHCASRGIRTSTRSQLV